MIVLIAYSMVIRVQLYQLGVSLWYDEGLLVANIIPQSMSELISNPLNTGWGAQSAPLFYLIIVKLFTLLFGVSETSVRAWSFIVCAGLLVCMGFLLKKAYRLNAVYVWFGVALAATLPYYIRYANEMKPYIGDACFALLIILLYALYREKRVSLVLCSIIYAVILEFSTPSVFFIASVFLVEFLRRVREKDRRAILQIVCAGVCVMAVFGANYFFWLRPTATDPWMNDFWAGWRFRFPFSIEAIRHDLHFATEFFMPLGSTKYLMLAFGAMGYIISLFKRNLYSVAVGLSFLLLLVASSLGKYPIVSRLWLFFYAFVILYAVVFLASIWVELQSKRTAAVATALVGVFLAGFLLAGNASFPSYAKGQTDNDYPGMNINPLISYVQENIQDGETLYSFETATPILKFKNGFASGKIGNVSADNILYGDVDTAADIDRIAKAGTVYLLYYRGYLPFSGDFRINDQVVALSTRGYVDRVMDVNYTPLYRYADDIKKVTTQAEIRLLRQNGDALRIEIRNTGKTILESGTPGPEGAIAPPPGAVHIVEQRFKDGSLIEEQVIGNLSSPIRIGESQIADVNLLGGETADHVQITLVSEGRYDFSEIGMAPIPIQTS
ncbi:hypothetical protein AGMMS49983_16360 [Clostridia bacterium]|nr:hypothetical protein AGMMS49983_16360 [Clostridia bacterium]